MASIPRYADTQFEPLVTDDDVLDRAGELLGRATIRQFWLMFLDAEQRQLPTLIPASVPHHPDPDDVAWLEQFVGQVTAGLEASSVVVTFERPGSEDLTPDDCRWLRALRDACLGASLNLRGPLLCHDEGVRWVAADEFAY